MKLNNLILTAFIVVSFTAMNSMASLSKHPSSFKETVVRGGTKTIELHISNSISSPLGYSFTIPVNWVKVDPSTGSVGGNSTLIVNLTLDASDLAEGKYNTSISLNDPHHGGLSFIKEMKSVPNEFQLMQNYPDPFNPSTIISFSIPESQHVSLIVYDLLGKEIAVLVNEAKQASSYNLQFAILNSQLASGIYFYTLKTDRFVQTKKCY